MLPSAFLSQIISPSRRTSNRPFAPGVKAIPTSGPKALKNSLATHVAVAWCCQATQYRISTKTFHSPFVAMSTLLTSRLGPFTDTKLRYQRESNSTRFCDDVKRSCSLAVSRPFPLVLPNRLQTVSIDTAGTILVPSRLDAVGASVAFHHAHARRWAITAPVGHGGGLHGKSHQLAGEVRRDAGPRRPLRGGSAAD